MSQTRSATVAFRWLSTIILVCVAGGAQAADSRVLNALLDGVLEASVKDGYVDYPAIARNVRFYKYIEALAEFDPATLADDKERLAFWINAYNAFAIKSVIDGNSPVEMVSRLKFFRTGEHRVGGRDYDLQSIEDEILNKLGDPRVHFARVPATYSGPKLRSEAYRADELERQLEDNTRDFINDKRKNRYSVAAQQAKLSKVFDDYKNDFGGEDKAVMEYVSRYVEDKDIAKALARGNYEIKYLEYDRSINGRPME